MRNTEKFMFDTIFDELEPILPEIADVEEEIVSSPEEVSEAESAEIPAKSYNETDIHNARQEGFVQGKQQGASEALTGNDKLLADTLSTITNDFSVFISEQKQANQELSYDTVTLALTIVRKFFPTLNENTALDEIKSILTTVLKRLIGEPEITIKVNPAISNDLSDSLKTHFVQNDATTNVLVVADVSIDKGNCKIEWPNGSTEKNLDMLMHEVDDIIAQNSNKEITALATPEE